MENKNDFSVVWYVLLTVVFMVFFICLFGKWVLNSYF